MGNTLPEAVQIGNIDYPETGLGTLTLQVDGVAARTSKDLEKAETLQVEVTIEVQDLSIGGKFANFIVRVEFLEPENIDNQESEGEETSQKAVDQKRQKE